MVACFVQFQLQRKFVHVSASCVLYNRVNVNNFLHIFKVKSMHFSSAVKVLSRQQYDDCCCHN